MKPEKKTIRLGDIIFDEALYPRKEHSPALAQKYADSIDSIEAAGNLMCVSPDYKLLDGKHRWLGYRKAFKNDDNREIPVLVYPVSDEREQFSLAVRLNSQHGSQLTTEDKIQDAIKLYGLGFTYDTIAEQLSVGKKRVSDWLSRTVKEEKDRRNEKIFDMWMECSSQQTIAKEVGITQQQVKPICDGFTDSVLKNQTCKSAAEHASSFDPPIYNIWKQQAKSGDVSHFGNTEVRWVDNLLYFYTSPFDVVIDPFGGSG
jgi:hypothetical protein